MTGPKGNSEFCYTFVSIEVNGKQLTVSLGVFFIIHPNSKLEKTN